MKKLIVIILNLLFLNIVFSQQELRIKIDSTFGVNGIFDTLTSSPSTFNSLTLDMNKNISSTGEYKKYNNTTEFLVYNFYPHPGCVNIPSIHTMWFFQHNPSGQKIIHHNNQFYWGVNIQNSSHNTYLIFKVDSLTNIYNSRYLDCSFGIGNNYQFADYLGDNNHKLLDMKIHNDWLYVLTDSNTTIKTLYRLTLDGILDSTFGKIQFNDTTIEQISKTRLKVLDEGIFILSSKQTNNNYMGYCYKLTHDGKYDSTFNYNGTYYLSNVDYYTFDDIIIDGNDYYLVGLVITPGNFLFIKKLGQFQNYIIFDFSFNFVKSLRASIIHNRLFIFGQQSQDNRIFTMDINKNFNIVTPDTNINYILTGGNVELNDVIIYDSFNFYLCGNHMSSNISNGFIIKGKVYDKTNIQSIVEQQWNDIVVINNYDGIHVSNNGNKRVSIQIFDTSGKLLVDTTLDGNNNKYIKLKHNNIYILKIFNNNKHVIKKIIN